METNKNTNPQIFYIAIFLIFIIHTINLLEFKYKILATSLFQNPTKNIQDRLIIRKTEITVKIFLSQI